MNSQSCCPSVTRSLPAAVDSPTTGHPSAEAASAEAAWASSAPEQRLNTECSSWSLLDAAVLPAPNPSWALPLGCWPLLLLPR
eukprot:COSAG01_NODE_645_length_14553_cov_32.925227_10_plen_83_part_00